METFIHSTHRMMQDISTVHNENREHKYTVECTLEHHKLMTSTFIPDVVTAPLALYVMEDGCSAAPGRDEFIRIKKGTKLEPK